MPDESPYTPDLIELKKRRDELNEMILMVEQKETLRKLEQRLRNHSGQVRIDIFDNLDRPNYSQEPVYIYSKFIKILVD